MVASPSQATLSRTPATVLLDVRCRTVLRVGLSLLALAATACSQEGSVPPLSSIALIASPPKTGSAEPNLAVDARGRVHMSWLERTDSTRHALRYARLEGGTWSEPTTIVERSDFFVNWADFPSVFVTPTGRIMVHWLQRSADGTYTYDTRIAQSTDDGRHWSEPAILHRDGIAAEHGFASLFAAEGDSIEAVWLDGRNTVDSTRPRAMQLATTRIAPDGSFGAEQIIDTRICDCCQTSVAITSAGPVVVYRDRTEDEIRDIGVVRRVNGRWTEPAKVHNDNWQIAACPVNGPSIAARGDTVVVAWFTGAQDTARVRVAFSTDAGASFSPPVRVDDGTPAGRVDVEFDAAGRAIVSWLERTGGENAEVRVRALTRSGTMSAPMTIASSSSGRATGFARMVRRGEDLVVAWTQAGDSARVQVAVGHLTHGRQ